MYIECFSGVIDQREQSWVDQTTRDCNVELLFTWIRWALLLTLLAYSYDFKWQFCSYCREYKKKCFSQYTLHFKINIFGGKAVQRGSILKTAVFGQLSYQFPSFDHQSEFYHRLRIFSLQNPHTFCKKKFPVKLCIFWSIL